MYAGHEWLLGPAWAFGQQKAAHALRLAASGLFDRHAGVNIILGHLGEGLPYSLWLIDHHNKWSNAALPYPAKRPITEYFTEHFYVTTSGNFRTQSLLAAVSELSADRVLFSTDWRFENVDHAAGWFDSAPLNEPDRRKIGRDNALALFRLP
ncbi:amidohydrolase family protein [Amycolatopsis sp. NPDC051372]|uniref:amidohydrolase family protein n=1 Tax=unclassified Amycolatopsis TaxID=2618356 RepID=UPI00341E20FE